MITLIQRVLNAKVVVDDQTVGEIRKGILALVGVCKNDTEADAKRIAQRITSYRIFEDKQGKMNLSLSDIKGELLLVPQFTLPADTRKGTRPSFTPAAPPSEGERLFNFLVDELSQSYGSVATGQFGADMKVHLINDGPVTFWLES